MAKTAVMTVIKRRIYDSYALNSCVQTGAQVHDTAVCSVHVAVSMKCSGSTLISGGTSVCATLGKR